MDREAAEINENSSAKKPKPGENPTLPSFYFEPNGVPVFTPTMKEFKDFYKFIQSVSSYGQKAGLVKVIPPKAWIKKVSFCLIGLRHYRFDWEMGMLLT